MDNTFTTGNCWCPTAPDGSSTVDGLSGLSSLQNDCFRFGSSLGVESYNATLNENIGRPHPNASKSSSPQDNYDGSSFYGAHSNFQQQRLASTQPNDYSMPPVPERAPSCAYYSGGFHAPATSDGERSIIGNYASNFQAPAQASLSNATESAPFATSSLPAMAPPSNAIPAKKPKRASKSKARASRATNLEKEKEKLGYGCLQLTTNGLNARAFPKGGRPKRESIPATPSPAQAPPPVNAVSVPAEGVEVAATAPVIKQATSRKKKKVVSSSLGTPTDDAGESSFGPLPADLPIPQATANTFESYSPLSSLSLATVCPKRKMDSLEEVDHRVILDPRQQLVYNGQYDPQLDPHYVYPALPSMLPVGQVIYQCPPAQGDDYGFIAERANPNIVWPTIFMDLETFLIYGIFDAASDCILCLPPVDQQSEETYMMLRLGMPFKTSPQLTMFGEGRILVKDEMISCGEALLEKRRARRYASYPQQVLENIPTTIESSVLLGDPHHSLYPPASNECPKGIEHLDSSLSKDD